MRQVSVWRVDVSQPLCGSQGHFSDLHWLCQTFNLKTEQAASKSSDQWVWAARPMGRIARSSLTSLWMDQNCTHPSHFCRNWRHKLVRPSGVWGPHGLEFILRTKETIDNIDKFNLPSVPESWSQRLILTPGDTTCKCVTKNFERVTFMVNVTFQARLGTRFFWHKLWILTSWPAFSCKILD